MSASYYCSMDCRFNPLQVRYKPYTFFVNTPSSLCFNPLQVRYKLYKVPNKKKKKNCFNPLQVRYKPAQIFPYSALIFVSIPYRYATNIEVLSYFVDFCKRFQSLIGTLQTNLIQLCFYNPFQFQSLIGTLQTCFLFSLFALRMCFNPLQVRYKRERHFKTTPNTKPVSIPYRYATNGIGSNPVASVTSVSIPYRYATNLFCDPIPFLQDCKFQSLIGTLQTESGCYHGCLNILFQSLIGTLQTIEHPGQEIERQKVSIPYRYATNA